MWRRPVEQGPPGAEDGPFAARAAAFMKSEVPRRAKLIKDANIRAD